jgi:5-methylcytosine-specific restriction endonuclease McrA
VLGSPVLVLNRVFQAIRITTVRRAFSLLATGHARVLTPNWETCTFEDWMVRPLRPGAEIIATPRLRIPVPRAVVLSEYDRPPRLDVRFSRRNVYLRDEHRCQYCGRTAGGHELSLDHVLPLSRGGTTSWENVVAACRPCNLRKGNRTPHEAGLRLLRPPFRPRAHPFVGGPFAPRMRPEWQELGLAVGNA